MNIVKISKQIEKCYDRTSEIWNSRTKFSVIHEDRLRLKMREIHLLQETLFRQLWEFYCNQPEDIDIECLGEEKISGRIRITYCDGIWHFVTDSKDELVYGYQCNC